MRGKAHRRVNSSASDQSSKGQSRPSLAQLQDKLAALAPGMNRGVDFFEMLQRAVDKGPVALQIPETLLMVSKGESVFLLTESDGFVRVIRSETALSDFLTTSSLKNRFMRNLNPQGVNYPKFVTFRRGVPEFTLRRVAEVKRYIEEGICPAIVQRYVVPYKYSVSKTLVHWRRVKQAKAYFLHSRETIRKSPITTKCISDSLSKSEGQLSTQNFTLDLSFLASTHNIRSCTIKKSTHLTDFQCGLVAQLRQGLEAWVLVRCEQLEEFLFHVMQSQDGLSYVLDLPCAKVSPKETCLPQAAGLPICIRSGSSERSTDASETWKARNRTSEGSSPLASPKQHNTDISDQYIADHITEMSELIDELRTESRMRKEESGVLRRVRFERYPRELLPRIIHHVYTHILQDSRLTRYYLDKSRVLAKLESSIRQVFLHGCNRFIKAKVLAVHTHMAVSSQDFNLYIGYFGEAMRREGVRPEDEAAIREFLEGFRQYVVQ